MREIYDHKSGLPADASDQIRVFAADAPGPGNACHEYIVTLHDPVGPKTVQTLAQVRFQKGPLQENAFNGCSNESILALVVDRLKGFQSGPYACRENALALTKIQEAIMWLHQRTKDRAARSVEAELNGKAQAPQDEDVPPPIETVSCPARGGEVIEATDCFGCDEAPKCPAAPKVGQ